MPLNRKPNPSEIIHAQQRIAAAANIPMGRIVRMVKNGMTWMEIINSVKIELAHPVSQGKQL